MIANCRGDGAISQEDSGATGKVSKRERDAGFHHHGLGFG